MGTSPAQAVAPAYVLGPGEGEARQVLGDRETFKATAERTNGLFALKESLSPHGSGPPLHVHEREDEACYVVDGDVTLFVEEDVVSAPAGTWVYLPRGVPHSVRVESAEARMLWLIVPGAFASFFAELFPTADGDVGAQPDIERMATTAARYGVTVLGPTPEI